jgi:hypothetical protein
MAPTARMPPPTRATAARRGREMPPVSGSFGDTLAEALVVGLAEALAVGLADALADALMEALAEDVASPPPDTLTLAVISGCIEQWYV